MYKQPSTKQSQFYKDEAIRRVYAERADDRCQIRPFPGMGPQIFSVRDDRDMQFI